MKRRRKVLVFDISVDDRGRLGGGSASGAEYRVEFYLFERGVVASEFSSIVMALAPLHVIKGRDQRRLSRHSKRWHYLIRGIPLDRARNAHVRKL